jgi:hypothetical protein
MGTRTLVDMMLNALVGDIGGFSAKLNEAVSRGMLTPTQRQTVGAAVEAGNAATHRGFRPTHEQVLDALDIVEHALCDNFVMGAASNRLAASIPPRSKGP